MNLTNNFAKDNFIENSNVAQLLSRCGVRVTDLWAADLNYGLAAFMTAAHVLI